ncbi:hypothetical protein [Microbacterium sp.]|uniref:hypothetical protein n=1 Tax=Microbacterium sp. TaxID=51671 RepID=UPI003F709340
MALEHVIGIALPHSARAEDPFHVSVFLTPKLTPDAPPEPLSTFAVFPHWAQAVRDGFVVELTDQNGPLECTAVLDPIEPKVWDAVFPPDTPVGLNAVPEWEQRRWRTFDAKAVHDIGKLVGLLSAMGSPVDPPLPSTHPLTPGLLSTLRQLDAYSGRIGVGRIDDEVLTRVLDEVVGESSDRPGVRRVPDGAGSTSMAQTLALLHQARRYYDRPESKADYRGTPDGPPPPPVKPPVPEFHERVASVGDHARMLRMLGLVIDLRVSDVSRLRKSRWLRAVLTVAGSGGAVVVGAAPRVRCEATADGALVTVPGTSEWAQGALALGETASFSVLDADADGTALKTEQYLRVLPRLLASQANIEPVDAASPALRTSGFTVARTRQAATLYDRIGRQKSLEAVLAAPVAAAIPELLSEDVARGMRVEVWDDTVKTWRSLHERHTIATVLGLADPIDLGDGHGFIQTAPAEQSPATDATPEPPINVHEAMFGWEGWSLSVPKPGKRVPVDPTADEPDDAPTAASADAPHPVSFAHSLVDHTLPRLRFGRDYAFRAWLVDLAGNVRPAAAPPLDAPDDLVSGELGARFAETIAARYRDAGLSRLRAVGSGLERTAASEVLQPTDVLPPGKPPVLGRGEQAKLRAEIRAALGTRAAAGDELGTDLIDSLAPARDASRAAVVTEIVRSSFAAATANTPAEASVFTATAAAEPAAYTRAIVGQIGALGGAFGPNALGPGIELALKTVTELRPYLRWDPVPPPTLVARARYSEGESQRVLVIRSGVEQHPDTLDVTVTDPETYLASVAAIDPGTTFAASSERHLVPPKTSQLQAEQHAAFDRLVADGPAGVTLALAAAVRENGTLYDIDVASLDTPGVRTPVTGVSVVADASVDPADIVTLPIPQGEAPPAGQYVVHDVDDLVLPYLPDPLARGVSIVFPDASITPALPLPFGIEGFTADYEGEGDWPRVRPLRLTLTDGSTPRVDVASRVIDFSLPAGTVQRFRLSSCLQPAALTGLGMWRSWPQVIQSHPLLREAARDGYFWSITPKENLLLVHATPRPIAAPRPVNVRALRPTDATFTYLWGGVHLHGASTEQLTAEASWTEYTDDLGQARWQATPSKGAAFTTRVTPHERLGILFPLLPQGDLDWPADPSIRIHGVRHDFGDTKHRVIDYRLRASTRFREYFPPSLLTPGTDAAPFDDGSSTVSDLLRVSVPSSARPQPPVVHSVVPLFRWSHDDPTLSPVADEGTAQPGQPIAERHTRRAGVRIYLERPWFSSGEGELLGVLVQSGAQPGPGGYSLWAQDPIWVGNRFEDPHMPPLNLIDFWRAEGSDDVWRPGEPVARGVDLVLPTGVDTERTYRASVLGYRPQYSEERRKWFVDVALNPGAIVWPFIRLAVARYQPGSIANAELSAPVLCDFVQVPPERAATVSRLDEHGVRVVVTGPVTHRPLAPRDSDVASIGQNRALVANLQEADPEIGGDLGWITRDSVQLDLLAYDASAHTAAWGGSLSWTESIPLRRPGPGASSWRVTVEEWERFPGDPVIGRFIGAAGRLPQWEQRLVFADEVYL